VGMSSNSNTYVLSIEEIIVNGITNLAQEAVAKADTLITRFPKRGDGTSLLKCEDWMRGILTLKRKLSEPGEDPVNIEDAISDIRYLTLAQGLVIRMNHQELLYEEDHIRFFSALGSRTYFQLGHGIVKKFGIPKINDITMDDFSPDVLTLADMGYQKVLFKGAQNKLEKMVPAGTTIPTVWAFKFSLTVCEEELAFFDAKDNKASFTTYADECWILYPTVDDEEHLSLVCQLIDFGGDEEKLQREIDDVTSHPVKFGGHDEMANGLTSIVLDMNYNTYLSGGDATPSEGGGSNPEAKGEMVRRMSTLSPRGGTSRKSTIPELGSFRLALASRDTSPRNESGGEKRVNPNQSSFGGYSAITYSGLDCSRMGSFLDTSPTITPASKDNNSPRRNPLLFFTTMSNQSLSDSPKKQKTLRSNHSTSPVKSFGFLQRKSQSTAPGNLSESSFGRSVLDSPVGSTARDSVPVPKFVSAATCPAIASSHVSSEELPRMAKPREAGARALKRWESDGAAMRFKGGESSDAVMAINLSTPSGTFQQIKQERQNNSGGFAMAVVEEGVVEEEDKKAAANEEEEERISEMSAAGRLWNVPRPSGTSTRSVTSIEGEIDDVLPSWPKAPKIMLGKLGGSIHDFDITLGKQKSDVEKEAQQSGGSGFGHAEIDQSNVDDVLPSWPEAPKIMLGKLGGSIHDFDITLGKQKSDGEKEAIEAQQSGGSGFGYAESDQSNNGENDTQEFKEGDVGTEARISERSTNIRRLIEMAETGESDVGDGMASSLSNTTVPANLRDTTQINPRGLEPSASSASPNPTLAPSRHLEKVSILVQKLIDSLLGVDQGEENEAPQALHIRPTSDPYMLMQLEKALAERDEALARIRIATLSLQQLETAVGQKQTGIDTRESSAQLGIRQPALHGLSIPSRPQKPKLSIPAQVQKLSIQLQRLVDWHQGGEGQEEGVVADGAVTTAVNMRVPNMAGNSLQVDSAGANPKMSMQLQRALAQRDEIQGSNQETEFEQPALISLSVPSKPQQQGLSVPAQICKMSMQLQRLMDMHEGSQRETVEIDGDVTTAVNMRVPSLKLNALQNSLQVRSAGADPKMSMQLQRALAQRDEAQENNLATEGLQPALFSLPIPSNPQQQQQQQGLSVPAQVYKLSMQLQRLMDDHDGTQEEPVENDEDVTTAVNMRVPSLKLNALQDSLQVRSADGDPKMSMQLQRALAQRDEAGDVGAGTQQPEPLSIQISSSAQQQSHVDIPTITPPVQASGLVLPLGSSRALNTKSTDGDISTRPSTFNPGASSQVRNSHQSDISTASKRVTNFENTSSRPSEAGPLS